jgi:subtilisin family serine protease
MVESPDNIAPFSSRGPCAVERRKPDIVAPGTIVLSTRSSLLTDNGSAWAEFPPAESDYMFMGGTSMAAPLVAGGVALIRQYLRNHERIANPSAALLKAAVVHSGQYIADRHPHGASCRWADDEQGWGRMNLGSVLCPAAPTRVQFYDESAQLETGEMTEFRVEIGDSSVHLRITLVYTDRPGNRLVNDLNLIAYSPDGRYYVGNDFAGWEREISSEDELKSRMDRYNNVEGIVVLAPTKGVWTIRVYAFKVPEGRQDFALVVSGGNLTRLP